MTISDMKQRAAALILIGLFCYLAAYLGMSLNGGYIPFTAGTNGIKDWIWAPSGITDSTGQFRRGMLKAFLPLFWLDCKLWHNDWTGSNGPHKPLKPPAWRLGLVKGSARETALRQLELAKATILTNAPEVVRAEYQTADMPGRMQVELTFSEGQVASVHYYFH